MLCLREINLESAEQEWRFFQELPPENGFSTVAHGMSLDEFVGGYIPKHLSYAKGEGLPEDRVPATIFLLWDGDEIVGVFHVRHYLNNALRDGAGHIGYAVHPARRNRSYGTRGLALALDALRAMPDFPEDEIYLSCARTNPASLRVMLNNGGYVHHQDEKETYVRIKR